MNKELLFNIINKIYQLITKNIVFIYLICVFILSCLTYLANYHKPRTLFWDENYHIASSQKYIDGVFFMEPHPPLGKMLIALGELIYQKNNNLDKDYYNKTDHIKSIPDNYSFTGVRMASTYLACFSSILFFLILFVLFNNPHVAFLFSFLFLFENSIILQSRSAMLEGQYIFFILLGLLYFFILIKYKVKFKIYNYFILGIIIGFAVSIKLNCLILSILFVFMYLSEYKENIISLRFNFFFFINTFFKIIISLIGIISVLFTVYYIHIAICTKVINNRYYEASEKYEYLLRNNKAANPLYLYVTLTDHIKFINHYQKGVPKLDLCKPGENGSHPIGWSLGIKSINYRWEKKDKKVKYLYLQGNPVIWFLGLIGIIMSIILIGSVLFFNNKINNESLFYNIFILTVIYIIYMFIMLRIERVMYLYHYFLPLIISLILSYLIFVYLFERMIINKNIFLFVFLFIICMIIFFIYIFFSPFTYYKWLTLEQFQLRNWFDMWGLVPIT